MVAAGFFRDERVELIRGVVIQMEPAEHAARERVIEGADSAVLPHWPDGRTSESSFLAAGGHSPPEPRSGGRRNRICNRNAHPDRAFLIIEVADSSLKFDRQEKAELYARAGGPRILGRRRGGPDHRRTQRAHGRHVRPGHAVSEWRGRAQRLAFMDVAVRVDEVFEE